MQRGEDKVARFLTKRNKHDFKQYLRLKRFILDSEIVASLCDKETEKSQFGH